MQKRNKGSLFIVNFITGMSDGILIPFVTCIITFSVLENHLTTVKAGFLISLFGGAIYGLARYFGERAEIRQLHPELSREDEKKEDELRIRIGIDEQLNQEIKLQRDAEKKFWLEEIKKNDLGWEEENKSRAAWAGFHTGIGFVAAGCLLLFPFLISTAFPWDITNRAFYLTLGYPLLLLALLNTLKSLLVGQALGKYLFKALLDAVIVLSVSIAISVFIGESLLA